MPAHIKPFDNKNIPIVDETTNRVQRTFFNKVVLSKGEVFSYTSSEYETCCVVSHGTCSIAVGDVHYADVGKRKHLFEGKPDSVYVPVGVTTRIEAMSADIEVYIAGGRTSTPLQPFRVSPEEVDVVQYGSDETKTHRKIYHILGKNQEGKVDKLLVSELFTVGAGGWSGFPPHKHHVDRLPVETDHEEVYHFKFNPSHGFGAQFAYTEDDDFGPVYHIKDGSTIVLEQSYHPAVVAPGYEMYYFTILVGKTQRPLVQYFHPAHEYQLKTIPGIMDMVKKFK